MRLLTCAIAAGVIAAATPATAAVLYSDPATSAQVASPGEISVTFNGGAGAATATFDILGYLTLAGAYDGPYPDTFTLEVNGSDVYSALFPLGGVGVTSVTLAPAGAAYNVISGGYTLAGGRVSISVPLTLVEGSNTLKFAYAGVPQGTGDEAWALSNLTVTGNALAPTGVGGVPEPATWAMMILGFFGMGSSLRSRRRMTA